jgi:deoxycytidylate deaminase
MRISLSLLYTNSDKTDMKFRLSAGIIIGKHLVPASISYNCDRTMIHGEIFYSKHAEHGALLFLKNKRKRNNVKLIVIRKDAFGQLVNSTPCEICINRIKDAGIKKVIYVNDKSELVENKIDNIKYIKSENKIVTQWFKVVSKYNTHIRNFRTNI